MKDNLIKKQKKLLQSSKSRASLKQFCEAHNYSIDDFLELQQHWYQKYKEAGYKDYEHTDPQTGHVSSYCDSGIGEIKKFLQNCANNKQDWLQTDSAIRKQTIHSLITIFVDELKRQRVCLWKKRSNLQKQLRSNNFNNQDNQNSSPSLSHNNKTNGQGIRASEALTKKLNKSTTQINNLTDLIQVFSVYSEELHNRVIVHREHNKRYPQYKKSYKEVKRLIIKGRKMMPDTIRSLLNTNKQTNPLHNEGLMDNLKKLNFKVASDNNNNHEEEEKDKREEIEEMFQGLTNRSCWEFTDVTINGSEE